MTENEKMLIERQEELLDFTGQMLYYAKTKNNEKCTKIYSESKKASETIIKAFEELEQYRAIGTVEEIKKVVQFLSLDNDNGIIEDLQLLNKYQFIGTVEECREARERQKPQIPNILGDGYDNEGNLIYNMYDCPNRGKSYEVDYHDYKYCPECGQAIDRSDLDKLV